MILPGERSLHLSERRLLAAKLRARTLPMRLYQRYRIVAEAARGRTAPAIADRLACHPHTVYHWMHRFNTSGFETFEQPTNPQGRMPILQDQQVLDLIKVALSRPGDLGLPFTEWSTPKLTAYCRGKGLLPPITTEWVRRVLRREGVTPQRLKTWKSSPDPAFEAKKRASSASTRGGRQAER